MATILVKGGRVTSANDGDIHQVPAREVSRLYGLSPNQVTSDDRRPDAVLTLYPDYAGRYNLAEEIKQEINKEVNSSLKTFADILNSMTLWERFKFLVKGKYDWV